MQRYENRLKFVTEYAYFLYILYIQKKMYSQDFLDFLQELWCQTKTIHNKSTSHLKNTMS